jgi:pyridinium-3,5-bisthiocarboxylic acid mononucleotide nickel chelatase
VRALIFDPFAGISGDMVLGALVDLGLDPEWLRAFIASLDLGDIKVNIERVQRRTISCGRVYFDLPHQHAHRHLKHVVEIIEKSGASAIVKQRAIRAFTKLAAAEAAVHGTTIEKVHFHEVGALDSILDVLCSMAGITQLGFERFFTRPVAIGSGWVEIEHGRFPLPAPATLKLLEGLPVRETGFAEECTTPTGAAILAALVEGSLPANVIAGRSGFGAGTRDPENRPNALRLIECEVELGAADSLYIVQADIDDLVPEYAPGALEAIMSAGALDAVSLPVGMKKGRTGLRIEALVPEASLEAVLAAFFQATPTIGARYWPVTRPALARREEVVEWRGQRVRRKRVVLPGGEERSKPEYEDVVKAAAALGLPAYQVRLALEGDEGATIVD